MFNKTRSKHNKRELPLFAVFGCGKRRFNIDSCSFSMRNFKYEALLLIDDNQYQPYVFDVLEEVIK